MNQNGQADSAPLLELREIRKNFGGVTALKHIDYEVPAGIIQAIIGPTGRQDHPFPLRQRRAPTESGSIRFRGWTSAGCSRTRSPGGHLAHFSARGVVQVHDRLENVLLGGIPHPQRILGFGLRLPRMRREERQIQQQGGTYLDFVGLADEAHSPPGPAARQTKDSRDRPGSGHRTAIAAAG